MEGKQPLAVRARGLTKQYAGGFLAVDGIDLEVRQGECFGLLGPNGAGKSSTMKMIYGHHPLTAGVLEVLGLDSTRQMRQIKARLGVVPQEDSLDPDFSALANLIVYARYFGINRSEAARRAQELLQFVQLQEKAATRVDELSGGMKRRLVIARALVNQPDLVVLDEPTTGLDPQARHVVWSRLRTLKEQGTTLLLTTHYMDEAYQLCDRLVIMDKGKILAMDTPRALVDRYAGNTALELWRLTASDQERAIALAGDRITRHEQAGDLLLLFTDSIPAADALVEHLKESGLHLPGYQYRPTTLEDVFLRLAGRSLAEGGE